MRQICEGYNAMIDNLIIHRDLKLRNLMIHFPDHTQELMEMEQEQLDNFLQNIDISKIKFEVKISDLGFSK